MTRVRTFRCGPLVLHRCCGGAVCWFYEVLRSLFISVFCSNKGGDTHTHAVTHTCLLVSVCVSLWGSGYINISNRAVISSLPAVHSKHTHTQGGSKANIYTTHTHTRSVCCVITPTMPFCVKETWRSKPLFSLCACVLKKYKLL